MNELLLGDEAVGLGAMHAGIGGAFSYPGTPATEIFEFIEQHPEASRVVARWSANEKVAYEEALGMSYAGKRALVSMKHVGLNVAADPFMGSALTGAHAGLVLAVADDPGMHSSQNEQDSRFYGQFAKIPVLEPSNQQEAYDMTREAFELSETYAIPVMVRLVTRLAHSRANVRTTVPAEGIRLGRAEDWRKWTLLPVNARPRFQRLLKLQQALRVYAEHTRFNLLTLHAQTGIIACGLAYNYVQEVTTPDQGYSILKLGVYPPPVDLVRQIVAHCDEIFVFEDGYPLIEEQLNGLLGVPLKRIRGKCSGDVPADGELDSDRVRTALGMTMQSAHLQEVDLPSRPPQLCSGCPHCDSFAAIIEAVGSDHRGYFFSDIGCYTLAALPPHNAIDTCVDMGASIGMGIGAAKAGVHPVICTIGESTFVHSGMPALIAAARADLNMTVVILDNAAVAMTGAQEVFATGDDLMKLLRGLGVAPSHLIRIEPLPKNHRRNVQIIREEIEHRGLSVVVACRPCIHIRRRRSTPSTQAAVAPNNE